jgi:hypothetical protein
MLTASSPTIARTRAGFRHALLLAPPAPGPFRFFFVPAAMTLDTVFIVANALQMLFADLGARVLVA